MRRAAGAAVLVSLLFAVAALAAGTKVDDPNDTPGLLDVHEVRIEPGKVPEWTVITYPRWTVRQIWDRGWVLVRLDTFGDPEPDYFAAIRSNGSTLGALLWQDRPTTRPDLKMGHLSVWRNGGHQVSVRIPLARLKIGPKRSVYRWSVMTLFTGPTCRATCFDPVPDTSPAEEPLPSTSPSPSPSETPSTTPTEVPPSS